METPQDMLENVAAKLGEHFDSVRIFVSRHDGLKEHTEVYTTGLGNIYTQLGQVNEWKGMQDQISRNAMK